MDSDTDKLDAWAKRLRLAEEDLRRRERVALQHDPRPSELLAFAAEYDKIALDRDNVASSYDELAQRRDRVGLIRDVAGSGRDRRARESERDMDAAAADRWLAGSDRDYGAGDRGDSFDDRSRSRQARDRAADDRTHAADDRDRAAEKASDQDFEMDQLRHALESRTVIGQAQGLLMARHTISADAAFAVLTRLSQNSNVKLKELAARLVAAAESDFA